MFTYLKSWSKFDWIQLSFRFLAVCAFLGHIHFDKQIEINWITYGSIISVFFIPLFALVAFGVEKYIITELLVSGIVSLFMTYEFGAPLWLTAINLSLGYYVNRKSLHFIVAPLTTIILPFVEFLILDSQPAVHTFLGIFNTMCVYALGFAISALRHSNEEKQQKLQIINEQYTILQQYSSQVERLVVLEERNRMAKELHDTIGHTFTSIIMGLETIKATAAPDASQEKVERLVRLTRTGLADVRRQVHEIRATEEDATIDEQLRHLTEQFMDHTETKVSLRIIGEAYDVYNPVKHTLARCLQEALTNALRHGQATSVNVLLHYEPNQLLLQVQDNGSGQEEMKYGFGLSAMQERLYSLQGKLYTDSKPNEGTIITCVIPQQTYLNKQEIKILLVDDQPLMRESLGLLLEAERDFNILTAHDGPTAIERCEQEQPHIVLMDVHMPDMDGITAARFIKERFPETRIIMITSMDNPALAQQAMSIGAEGYLLKSIPAEELAHTVRLVYRGGTIISRDIADQLFKENGLTEQLADRSSRPAGTNPYQLTDRELEILGHLVKGHRYKMIAGKLYLSEGTVRNYISSIYSKLHVRNRSEAVTKAEQEQLLSSTS
ncbi:helix-turn-helix transcriptional regulator [Paenibacillus sp. 481]|uniref:helix-turn-helix transcriptional regulator n=1 Tax=Paenibacillus sp. 481 TaxID=2835869 RepID=UPI001E623F03|nr:hybrid sensor histidine kinase/response regulator transcription factor [Paenibacillus sp. 481]UHA73796.1 hybrid sensor histidine kinase/response regulator transcription factor [Paenibacillus sp. 481]